ncbi:cholecystokinin receptor-like [Saccostrea echinata]|uniref:cholecystokinin receptor-like n=1 Tax=Saccostrea echinata TaxID=191078 RepID=UPI002A824D29|nr:cholecystokinin receptor-like [Saccostrea echinata]XP_061178510.1 cholecystokinin receptor-like [Saccostrea echinata]
MTLTMQNLTTSVDTEKLLRQWNHEISRSFTLSTVVHSVLFTVGTFGNLFIIFIYNFKMKGYKDDRYFIPILAVVDMLACAFSTWFALKVNIFPVMFPDDVLCKCLLYVNYLATQSSIFLLVVISIQRFLKICRPFQKQMTLYWKRFSLVTISLVTTIILIPELIFYGRVPVKSAKYNVTGYICGPIRQPESMATGLISFTAAAMSVSVISIAVIVIIYLYILKHLIRQTRVRKLNHCRSFSRSEASDVPVPGEDKDQSESPPTKRQEINGNREKDKEVKLPNYNSLQVPTDVPKLKRSSGSKIKLSTRRLTFMFMTISLTNVVSNIPTIVYVILCVNDPEAWFRNPYGFLQQLFQFMRAMRVVNHAMNPFLYGLFDGRFRDEIRKLCCNTISKIDL